MPARQFQIGTPSRFIAQRLCRVERLATLESVRERTEAEHGRSRNRPAYEPMLRDTARARPAQSRAEHQPPSRRAGAAQYNTEPGVKTLRPLFTNLQAAE
jgi:hypothetical protein